MGTVTPDMMYPSTACLVQHKLEHSAGLGLRRLGRLLGISLLAERWRASLSRAARYKKVLVIGSDVNSSMTDYTDRAVCILFGDGAGAVLLEPAKKAKSGIIDHVPRSKAPVANISTCPGRQPESRNA